MAAGTNVRIDGARLWDSLMEMARIGPGVAGGNDRQALTDADGEGRALFRRWCEAAGATVSVDRLGTMIARRAGTDPAALPVCIGSHLDTQPTGGRFDGVLGVLAGLEVLRTLQELGLRTRHPIEVINWTNEEGTRFPPALLASGVFAGAHDEAWALARTDPEGRRFGDELVRIGWRGEAEIARPIHAYLELHIEQGPILEAEGCEIGVVTHGQGLWWLRVAFTGRASHAGSTPMDLRADAGLGMARLVEAVNRLAIAHAPQAVGTVGRIAVQPNSPNVIPETAEALIDLRSPDAGVLTALRDGVAEAAAGIAAELGLGHEVEVVDGYAPVAFDDTLLSRVREAADRLGHSRRDIVSGAGHDACMVARVAPAAMIFCPCEGGLSHNEAEAITPDWAEAGAAVLCRAALATAEPV